jgi:peroxiredoxin
MTFIGTKYWYLISTVVLAVGAAWIVISANPSSAANNAIAIPREGFQAPDFSLKTLEGDTITLSSLRGQVVLVNLWASWCAPCRAEMPAIEKVYQRYKEQGFTVLAVNATNQDNLEDAQAFVQAHQLSFPILLDLDGSTSRAYQLQALPTSFFIDQDGIIQELVVGGPMSEALLRSQVEALLPEAP